MDLEPLISEQRIRARVATLGRRINADYDDDGVALVVVLKGAHVFAADLVRWVTVRCTIDFVTASSYGQASRSSGRVTINGVERLDVAGRRVLVIEDIVDTGLTGTLLVDQITRRGATDVFICALLRKPAARARGLPVLYHGFDIDDDFVVGYGMDFAERYRNLRGIHRLVSGR